MHTGTTELSCNNVLETDLFGLGGRRGWVLRLAVLGRRTWTLSISHSLRNVLVPLLLSLSVQQTDNGDRHVVTSNTPRVTV